MQLGQAFTSVTSTFRVSAFIYNREHGQGPDAPGEGQTNRRADQNAEAEAEAGGDSSIPAGTGKVGWWNGVGKGRKRDEQNISRY